MLAIRLLALAFVASGTPEMTAAQIVAAVNARDVGSTGWRRVRIDLIDNGVTTRTFAVVNVWRRTTSAEVRTLFHLEEPPGLAGTSYLEVEHPGEGTEFGVFLNLPTSRERVLTIAPENLGDGLLGSDFGYSDLRMLLPSASYRVTGWTTMLGHDAVILEATPADRAHVPWTRARYYIDPLISFVLGVDTFTETAVKRMRVETLENRDGVWTASRMTMTSARGRLTQIRLLGAMFRVGGVAASIFEPGGLPHAGARIASMTAGRQPSGRGER